MKTDNTIGLRRLQDGTYLVTAGQSQSTYPTLGAALDSLRSSLSAPRETPDVTSAKESRKYCEQCAALAAENAQLRNCIVQLALERYGGTAYV